MRKRYNEHFVYSYHVCKFSTFLYIVNFSRTRKIPAVCLSIAACTLNRCLTDKTRHNFVPPLPNESSEARYSPNEFDDAFSIRVDIQNFRKIRIKRFFGHRTFAAGYIKLSIIHHIFQSTLAFKNFSRKIREILMMVGRVWFLQSV